MAKERKYNIVTVEGPGQFPIDMLRYDSAVPHKEEDSYAILENRTHRTVNVLMEGEPTAPRWESFNWKVIKIRRIASA
jgi:hypothetical protein